MAPRGPVSIYEMDFPEGEGRRTQSIRSFLDDSDDVLAEAQRLQEETKANPLFGLGNKAVSAAMNDPEGPGAQVAI